MGSTDYAKGYLWSPRFRGQPRFDKHLRTFEYSAKLANLYQSRKINQFNSELLPCPLSSLSASSPSQTSSTRRAHSSSAYLHPLTSTCFLRRGLFNLWKERRNWHLWIHLFHEHFLFVLEVDRVDFSIVCFFYPFGIVEDMSLPIEKLLFEG